MNRSAFWSAVLALLVFTASANAAFREVRPGETPTLRPGEGLLLVELDSSNPVNALRISRSDGEPIAETIGPLPKGRSTRLFVVPANSYRWSSLDYREGDVGARYDLHSNREFWFEVKPGVINYPGDLVYTLRGGAVLHASDRSLSAIDWLRANAPDLYAHYSFLYAGHYTDPFPDFYKAERAARPDRSDADLERTLPPPAPGALPIPLEDLWRHSRVRSVGMNPRGDLLAEAIYEKDTWHVDVVDLKAGQATRVLDLDYPITGLQWTSDQVLAISAGTRVPVVRIIRIGDAGPKGRGHSGFVIQQPGRILAAVPGKPDHVLFEYNAGGAGLYDIDITSADALKRDPFARRARVDRGLNHVALWFVDGKAQPRAALVAEPGGGAWYWGSNGSFRRVLALDNPLGLAPRGLSADGNLFYALTDKGREQRELVAFDPVTGAIARTVFSKPGRDVEGVAYDSQGIPVGAFYFEDGQPAIEYFDQADRATSERIAKAFPGKTVLLMGRDDGGTHFVLLVSGSERPPQFYHFDAARGIAELIDDSAPWLSEKHLGTSRVIHAKGSDGLPIEAYLTLPADAKGRPPLIVYAHGGPIGVRDNLVYDPAVQLFASLGYAVLQVNFRGSEGFGRAFLEAGKRHFGSLIEDDIDAATRAALAQFPLDEKRMCAVGASYGGFSAIISSIRWPGRFRCAVSIAGVSDQVLLFTASDGGWTEARRQAIEKVIGDPLKDGEAMRKYSPVYRYKELALPVMLVHGTDDVRVDYEHTRRLVRMLNLAGHEPVLLTLEGVGHGNWGEKNEVAMWSGVAGFLRANLDAAPAAGNK